MSGGPKLLSGDFFETFRVFGVFGSVDGGGDLKSKAEKNPDLLEASSFASFCFLLLAAAALRIRHMHRASKLRQLHCKLLVFALL